MTGQDSFIPDNNSASIDRENATNESCKTDVLKQNAQDSENSFGQDNAAITDDAPDYAFGELAQDCEARKVETSIDAQTEDIPVSGDGDNQEKDIAFKQILETLTRLEGMFSDKIDRSEYELETLKRQSEEIQEYKSDLYASILTPILKPLVRTHAFMKRAILKVLANDADAISIEEFEFAFEDLEEVIQDAGIEIRAFEEGSPFEANAIKITGQNVVSDPEKNKTVCSSSSDAYLFKGLVLEKARAIVNVYSDESYTLEKDA